MILISITFIFKLGAAPFHNWAPDLYENIPTTIVMWIGIIPKITYMILYMNILNLFIEISFIWYIIGILSLIIGSFGLNGQWKIKRFIAYSSISHIGFLILALITQRVESFKYYILIYGLENILILMIINTRETRNLKELKGLKKKNMTLSIIFGLTLFSFAGIPPLAGFFAKLQIIESIIIHNYISIALIIVIISVISTGNYLIIIKTILYSQPKYKNKIYINKIDSNIISIIISIIIFIYKKTTLLSTLVIL